jgi:hypothetical protein
MGNGALTLLIGISILVWFVYNLFSPTREFKGSYKSIFQLCAPLAMIFYGWVWLTRKEPIPSRFPHFVFARIIDPITPLERGAKYHEPLNNALTERNIGEVEGGGAEITEGGRIDWVGLDIYLADLDDSLQFTRQQLRELGAPRGSVLEYQEGEKEIILPIHEF